MKYFKTLEAYKWDMSSYHKKDERIYYFESEDWMYKVGVMDNIANKDFPYFGFKAKKGDDFFYDMSIVTNDNMYDTMRTVLEILDYDFNNNDNLGYTFSLTGDKKDKREMLYRRLLRDEWDVNYIESENKFIVSK